MIWSSTPRNSRTEIGIEVTAAPQTGFTRLEDHPLWRNLGWILRNALKPYDEAYEAVRQALRAAAEAEMAQQPKAPVTQ